MPVRYVNRDQLTDTEIDALVHAANGRSCAATGEEMHLSASYVAQVRRRYLQKLRAVDSTHAVAIAFKKGILTGDDIDAS